MAKDLQKKETPEAYLIYALYDQDSNRYEVGKKVLTRNAANQHEELEEKLAIRKNGYIETFVVNETSQDVWFDNFRVLSQGSILVQETHYDPWGLELTGIGYEYAGVKKNKYLYNGKELIEDAGLQYYDYGARMYDPAIGRFNRIDRFSEKYVEFSTYNYAANNPINFVDFQGDSILNFMKNFRISGGITYGTLALNTNLFGAKTGLDISPYEQYFVGYQDGLEIVGSKNGQEIMRPSIGFSVLGIGVGVENTLVDGEKISKTTSTSFVEGKTINLGEKEQSIGFSFKAGIYLGLKLNIEYNLENKEKIRAPELNYSVPGILDKLNNTSVKDINVKVVNISDQDKESILKYLKSNFNDGSRD